MHTTTAIFVNHRRAGKTTRLEDKVGGDEVDGCLVTGVTHLSLRPTPSSTMRLLLAFVAALAPLAVRGIALEPRSMDDQIRVTTMQGWDWTDCGASLSRCFWLQGRPLIVSNYPRLTFMLSYCRLADGSCPCEEYQAIA